MEELKIRITGRNTDSGGVDCFKKGEIVTIKENGDVVGSEYGRWNGNSYHSINQALKGNIFMGGIEHFYTYELLEEKEEELGFKLVPIGIKVDEPFEVSGFISNPYVMKNDGKIYNKNSSEIGCGDYQSLFQGKYKITRYIDPKAKELEELKKQAKELAEQAQKVADKIAELEG